MSLASPAPLVGYGRKQSSSLNKKIMTLPRIEHPSKRFNDNDKTSLDIRGRSRNGKLIRNELSTPESPRRNRRSSSLKYNSKPSKYSEYLNDIPENVDTIYGQDRDKVRLPIFGKIVFVFFLFFILKIKFQVVDQIQHHQLILKKEEKLHEHQKF